jgi:hypothetical protein
VLEVLRTAFVAREPSHKSSHNRVRISRVASALGREQHS